MAKLIAQSGHSLDLPQRRVTLGESTTCDIPLATGLGLSSKHFEIEATAAGVYTLRDLSTEAGGSGTFLNGQTVQQQALQHGDVITAGELKLGFWNGLVQEEADSTIPAEVPGKFDAPDPLPSSTEVAALFQPESHAAPACRQPRATGRHPIEAPVPVPVMESSLTPFPPQAIKPRPLTGPPIAWVNPSELRVASHNQPGTAFIDHEISQEVVAAAAETAEAIKKAVPGRSRRRRVFLSRPAIALAAIAVAGGAGYMALQLPSVRTAIAPLWAKFTAWSNPPPPAFKTPSAAGDKGKTPASGKKQSPGVSTSVLPRAEHNDVVKLLLTERTLSLFQADLSQLVPFYNANASGRNLPPQREMTKAFRKHYGMDLDGFDKLTCLRGTAKDEFVFILTSSSRVDVTTLIDKAPDQANEREKQKRANIFSVKTPGRVYSAAQYDPFTVILGYPAWVESAVTANSGTSLREALCIFPETAAKNPGALIMVERISSPAPAKTPSVFLASVSNLFFKDKGSSTLTLTRNPEVKEEIFVEQSSAALRQQASSLIQAVRVGEQLAGGQKKPAQQPNPVEHSEIINTAEASIIIPDGESLLREAIDSVTRSFMCQSPSVELILTAQKAVFNFNQAKIQQAPETKSVTSVSEALELLQSGITITNRGAAGDVTYKLDRLDSTQAEEIVHLLVLEDRIGLVFRPNTDELSGNMVELAVKARDYLNAELLISLWDAAKFTQSDASDVGTAVRKVLEWANKDGLRHRISVGLPSLTVAESSNAAALLGFLNGRLTWKAGEEGYRTWLRRINPDPRSDARKIAGIFNEAQKAGAIKGTQVTELADAVMLLTTGVRAGTGSRSRFYKAGNLTHDELRAAAKYLRYDKGLMKVVDW